MSYKLSFVPQTFGISFVNPKYAVSTGTPVIKEYIGAEPYGGEYVVIPKANENQVLLTQNKILSENVTVTKVPYFETSNIYGDTVYIASEV